MKDSRGREESHGVKKAKEVIATLVLIAMVLGLVFALGFFTGSAFPLLGNPK